jgi:hypothetical protein
MLRPLAYVTDNKPCGSIRPSTEWGAEAFRIEPRHASIPDPCLGHGTSSPGTLLWVVRCSLGGVRTLSNGSGLLYFGGPGCACRGPMPSRSDGVVSESATLTAREILMGLFSARLRVATQASCLHTVARGTCWGPSASEGPQKHDLTMFLEKSTLTGIFGLGSEPRYEEAQRTRRLAQSRSCV